HQTRSHRARGDFRTSFPSGVASVALACSWRCALMDKLKLFVIGESSPDSAEWGDTNSLALVIAHNAEEALRMFDSVSGPATEIPFDKPMKLFLREFRSHSF